MGSPLPTPRYSSLQTCRSWIWEQATRSSQAAILSTPQLFTHIRHLIWVVRGPSMSRFNAQTSRLFRIHLMLRCREVTPQVLSSGLLAASGSSQVARRPEELRCEKATHLLTKLSLSCHLDVLFLAFSKVFFLAILKTMSLMTSCSKVPRI